MCAVAIITKLWYRALGCWHGSARKDIGSAAAVQCAAGRIS